MSMSETGWSFMAVGCQEIVNDARTIAYHKWACANGLYTCDATPELIEECYCPTDGTPDDYSNPAADGVCWYDPDIPESTEFLGMLVVRGPEFASTYSRTVVDSVGEGSVLQRENHRGKSMPFEVLLLATTCAGLEYGKEYIIRTLENATCSQPDTCVRCTGRQLCGRIYCDAEVDGDRGLRDLVTVGVVDGFEPIEEDSFGCCCWRKFIFTLHSEEPYSFSSKEELCSLDADPLDYMTCIEWSTFCADCLSELCVDCVENCDAPDEVCSNCRAKCGQCKRCFYDPVCTANNATFIQPLFLPSDNCFCEPIDKIISCCAIDDTRNNIDTTLRLAIYSGRHATDPQFNNNGLRNGRLRIWTNPAGLPPPTDDASWQPWRTRAACIELDISYIPPDATLLIDGRSERITLLCDNECRPFDKVVSTTVGGPIFPIGLSCSAALVCMEWDFYQTQFDATGTNLPSSLTVESYLRWRS